MAGRTPASAGAAVMGRRGRALVAALTLGALVIATAPAALTSTAGASEPSFTLTRQTPWTLLEGTVELDLTIVDAPLDATIDVSIHSPMLSRTEFDRTLTGDELGAAIAELEIPVGELPAIGSSERRLTLHLQEPGETEPDRVPITEAGVYPMELTLEVPDADADAVSFVTYLVVVDGDGDGPAVGERLGVSWVWPLDAEPELTDAGTLTERSAAELDLDGRLGRQVAAIAASDLPLTVVPGGFTAEQWFELDVTTSSTFTAALDPPRHVVNGDYVSLDLPSLLAHGLGDAARAGRLSGTAALERSLGVPIDTASVLALPVDDASFATLTDENVERMVVDDEDLEPVVSELTPARPFRLTNGDRAALAAAPDPGLVALLEGREPPALRAQQFLSALSLVASEAPNVTRGLVVVNPPSWDPEPEFLTEALGGLDGHPLLEPMTLERFFETVPIETDNGDPLERSIDADAAARPPVTAGEYRDALRSQESFREFAGPLSPRLVPGERALGVSVASTWGSDSSQAARQLDLIDSTIDDFLNQIQIPLDTTITLTARTGSIPLQFVNETGQEVTVRVTLQSDRLNFPDGASRDVTLPTSPSASTENFEVETITSGRFPLELTVSSPDGELVVSSARVDVRSTAVSGVGIFLTVGAGVVLAGWWLNDLRLRSKARRATITPSAGRRDGQ